jgi:hypothetical protein
MDGERNRYGSDIVLVEIMGLCPVGLQGGELAGWGQQQTRAGQENMLLPARSDQKLLGAPTPSQP